MRKMSKIGKNQYTQCIHVVFFCLFVFFCFFFFFLCFFFFCLFFFFLFFVCLFFVVVFFCLFFFSFFHRGTCWICLRIYFAARKNQKKKKSIFTTENFFVYFMGVFSNLLNLAAVLLQCMSDPVKILKKENLTM